MPTETQIADIFNTLAHPRRVRIFEALRNSPQAKLTYAEIAAITHIPDPSLAHHLRVLKRGGLVRARARGRHTDFSLNLNVLQFGLRLSQPLARAA